MTRPAWMTKLAAAAVIPLAIGMGVAVSAPSPVSRLQDRVADADHAPGMDGIDYAAVTGPVGSSAGRLPACADPARRGDLKPCDR